ncbi:MAG: zf-HC2 domain-containing protein [Desulfobacterales bacterium]
MECRDHDPRRCRGLASRISAYLDGELDAAGRREIEAHLEECLGCACCVETLRRTIELCRRAAAQPVPEEFSRRIGRLLERLVPPP